MAESWEKNRDPLLERSQYVKGVGPTRQVLLSKLGIETVEDLLRHYPRDYYDRSEFVPVGKIKPGQTATFSATVLVVSSRKIGRRRTILTVAVGDETGVVNLVFFNQPYLEKYFSQGTRIIASGKLTLFRGEKQITAPEFEIVRGSSSDFPLDTGRIVPVYPLTAGISQRMMRKIIRSALNKASGHITENLPSSLIRKYHFPERVEAFRQIHYPDHHRKLEEAVRRLKFEEVFFLHLLLKLRRHNVIEKRPRPPFKLPHPLLDRFLDNLPFLFTPAQEKVLGEIKDDMLNGSGLNRLLQGDVGSGKTVVGMAAMMLAVDNGFQAALMAPTEILAQQHYLKALEYTEDIPLRIELHIGSISRGDKEALKKDIKSGEVDIVIGTHALIQEDVEFKRLGFAIVDEQHRFGVKQRASLGDSRTLPHFLVMTATPIPRSMAQTVYGDLDLSVIDQMPSGERRVDTDLVDENDRDRVYLKLKQEFDRERQAFILYPLVEESEKSDLRAATAGFEKLQSGPFRNYPLGILHGRMSFEEKAKAIEMFRKGEILGLITTTVIEVGVDVPNASVLVINNPDRFGLAQLHQLRGRVGRSGEKGYCYMIIEEGMGGSTMERLQFFSRNGDGFAVAEKDLKMRGPGEIWGIRQSGYPSFKLINPLTDKEMVESSWRESEKLVAGDPELKNRENRVVSRYFRRYYKPKMELAEIG